MAMSYQIPTQAINPYYMGSQFQPMQNPYMDRLSQMQAQSNVTMPQQQLTPMGKIVESVDIVKATDIPMDGNMYYFPQADGSVIYGKQWMANGQTRILPFKAILNEEGNNLSSEEEKLKNSTINELTDTFQGMFDTVIDRIDKLEKSLKPTTRSKKEVSSDE